MAGAGGFEPAPHGFGVGVSKCDTSRMLIFSKFLQSFETELVPIDAFMIL